MKLLLRRDQKSGMLGKVTFILDVRADISPEERAQVDRYKMLDTMLYERLPSEPLPGTGFFARGAHYAANIQVSVRDLVQGKRIELKDIREMLGAEEELKSAAFAFKAILERTAQFGGEELIEV